MHLRNIHVVTHISRLTLLVLVNRSLLQSPVDTEQSLDFGGSKVGLLGQRVSQLGLLFAQNNSNVRHSSTI